GESVNTSTADEVIRGDSTSTFSTSTTCFPSCIRPSFANTEAICSQNSTIGDAITRQTGPKKEIFPFCRSSRYEPINREKVNSRKIRPPPEYPFPCNCSAYSGSRILYTAD